MSVLIYAIITVLACAAGLVADLVCAGDLVTHFSNGASSTSCGTCQCFASAFHRAPNALA
jgi:hypothetical protein